MENQITETFEKDINYEVNPLTTENEADRNTKDHDHAEDFAEAKPGNCPIAPSSQLSVVQRNDMKNQITETFEKDINNEVNPLMAENEADRISQ